MKHYGSWLGIALFGFLLFVGIGVRVVRAAVILCAPPDQSLACGYTANYNAGTGQCTIEGNSIENGHRIWGGQVCSIGGSDQAGYYNPFDTTVNASYVAQLPGSTPTNWQYNKTPIAFSDIPNGSFTDSDPSYTYGFFGGTISAFPYAPADDASALTVGTHQVSITGCSCLPTDVYKPSCPSTNVNGATTFSVSGGEHIEFDVTNMCRPGDGQNPLSSWGSDSFNITLNNATECYTASYMSYVNSLNIPGEHYNNVVDYRATADGVCTPASLPQGAIVVTSVDQNGAAVPNGPWTVSGPVSFSGSGSGTNNNEPAGSYIINAGIPPSGYSSPTVSPVSGSLGMNGTLSFTITWHRNSSSITCSVSNPNPTLGSTVTFTANGGNGSYTWSAPSGFSPISGSGSSFSTQAIAVGGPFMVTVSDGNSSCSASVNAVTPFGSPITITATPPNPYTTNPVLFSASGGTGVYSWSTNGGFTPQNSNNNLFSTVATVPGTWRVTVTDSGGNQGFLNITVVDPNAVQTVTVTPGSATVIPGGTVSFRATVKHMDGSTADVTGLAIWNTSDSSKLVSNGAGSYTASSAGGGSSVTISACYSSVCSNNVSVTIQNNSPLTITETPLSLSSPGENYWDGTQITFSVSGGTGSYTWNINPSGNVTNVTYPNSGGQNDVLKGTLSSPGNDTITVTDGAASTASTLVHVYQPACVFTASPTNVTLPATVSLQWTCIPTTPIVPTCTLGWPGHTATGVLINASKTVNPTTSTIYTLSCTGDGSPANTVQYQTPVNIVGTSIQETQP